MKKEYITTNQLAVELNRSPQTIRKIAKKLGINKPKYAYYWNIDKEDKALISGAITKSGTRSYMDALTSLSTDDLNEIIKNDKKGVPLLTQSKKFNIHRQTLVGILYRYYKKQVLNREYEAFDR